METLVQFSLPNGRVTEVYTVERDAGGVFIHNAMDGDQGGPRDTVHIDHLAATRIALALLRSSEPPIHAAGQNVLQFPDLHGAALRVSGVRFGGDA